MPRIPPQVQRQDGSKRKAAKERGPRETNRLPDRPDARRTWSGPPYRRSEQRWSGAVDFDGAKHHVGTFDTPRQWGDARDLLLATLDETRRQRRRRSTPLDGVTIAQFVGPAGQQWPWNFLRNGNRKTDSTMRHHEQCIRSLLDRFGDRRIKDDVSREEAELWANGATENQVTSAIAMFNDARSRDRTVVNPLDGLSRQRTRGRADMPDVLTRDEFNLLKEVAVAVHPGLYAPVIYAALEVAGTSAPRPGELFALERDELTAELGEVYINHAVKKDGKLGPPKYDQRRGLVLTPSGLDALQRVPVLHPRFFLPSSTGQLMTQSNWTTYWHPIRETFTALLPREHWLVRRVARATEAIAAEPDPAKRRRLSNGKLDLYELRHRAITDMVTPKPDGLGMASPDAAYQVGHRDGGLLIEKVYTHRSVELTRRRIRRAMGHDA